MSASTTIYAAMRFTKDQTWIKQDHSDSAVTKSFFHALAILPLVVTKFVTFVRI